MTIFCHAWDEQAVRILASVPRQATEDAVVALADVAEVADGAKPCRAQDQPDLGLGQRYRCPGRQSGLVVAVAKPESALNMGLSTHCVGYIQTHHLLGMYGLVSSRM